MTNKQYYCLNGDLIEVGKEYRILDRRSAGLVKCICERKYDIWLLVELESYDEFVNINSFQSLWQEQPDKDGWIKHTTGKQPVADDLLVEIKIGGFTSTPERAEVWGVYWEDGHITHYRIVEDKQEPEETFIDYIESFGQKIVDISPYEIIGYVSEYLQKKGI